MPLPLLTRLAYLHVPLLKGVDEIHKYFRGLDKDLMKERPEQAKESPL
jgi:hypothetical protein